MQPMWQIVHGRGRNVCARSVGNTFFLCKAMHFRWKTAILLTVIPAVGNWPCLYRIDSLAPALQRQQQQDGGWLQGRISLWSVCVRARLCASVLFLCQKKNLSNTGVHHQNMVISFHALSFLRSADQKLHALISFTPLKAWRSIVRAAVCTRGVLYSEQIVISRLEISRTGLFHMQHFVRWPGLLDPACLWKETKTGQFDSKNMIPFLFLCKDDDLGALNL